MTSEACEPLCVKFGAAPQRRQAQMKEEETVILEGSSNYSFIFLTQVESVLLLVRGLICIDFIAKPTDHF